MQNHGSYRILHHCLYKHVHFFPPYQCGGLNSEARPLYSIITQILLIALTRASLEMPHKTDSAVFISLPDTRPYQPGSLPMMNNAGLEEKAGFLPCHNSHHKPLANTVRHKAQKDGFLGRWWRTCTSLLCSKQVLVQTESVASRSCQRLHALGHTEQVRESLPSFRDLI